jgi:hypothetical protein
MKQIGFALLLLPVIFSFQNANAQYTAKDLCKPDVISLSGKAFTFGYTENGKALSLKVQRLSSLLAVEKEISVELGNKTCADLYTVQADTFHGYLNLMLQEVNNDKTCRILRYNKSLQLIADIQNADITRVNTFTAYDKEVSYYKEELFLVRPFSKDSINHFYLQKHVLKSNTTVFEYTPQWQVNFGNQMYHRCHIIRSDSVFVYLYVDVIKGSKQGQWVLFIDTRNGEIIHAECMNKDNEGYVFLYSGHAYDTKTGSLCIAGYKLKKSQVTPDYTRVDLALGAAKTAPVFLCTFDSSGFVKERMDNFVSVPPDVVREKEFKQYLFKINKLYYSNNHYSILTELVASPGTGNVFKTYGFGYTVLEHNEKDELQIKSNTFMCTLRDSKNKYAKNMFNVHELDLKKNADELFFKPAVQGPYKGFLWTISFAGDKIAGYSAYSNKTETTFGKITFDGKWQLNEVSKTPLSDLLRTFQPNIDQVIWFKNSGYDPETKIRRGLEGTVFKTF